MRSFISRVWASFRASTDLVILFIIMYLEMHEFKKLMPIHIYVCLFMKSFSCVCMCFIVYGKFICALAVLHVHKHI